jgi:hypothetical protein
MANTTIDLARTLFNRVGLSNLLATTGTAAVVGLALASKRPFEKKISTVPLVFPRDLDKFSLSMSFDFHEYKRRSIFDQPYMKKAGTIRLPVAKSIQDKFHAEWSTDKSDPIVGAILESVLFHAQKESDPNANTIDKLTAGLIAAGETGAAAAAGASIGKFKDTLSSVNQTLGAGADLRLEQLLQPLGLAVNPFLTVMFKEPSFKKHSFNWKLLARDPEESRIITSIVNEFKWHMLPDVATNSAGTLLNYPSMVQVGFYSNDDFLYRFKPCAITDLSVNYAPASTPSFFKGSQNVPTEVSIDIQLMEIEYWTKLDFQNNMVAGASMMSRK